MRAMFGESDPLHSDPTFAAIIVFCELLNPSETQFIPLQNMANGTNTGCFRAWM